MLLCNGDDDVCLRLSSDQYHSFAIHTTSQEARVKKESSYSPSVVARPQRVRFGKEIGPESVQMLQWTINNCFRCKVSARGALLSQPATEGNRETHPDRETILATAEKSIQSSILCCRVFGRGYFSGFSTEINRLLADCLADDDYVLQRKCLFRISSTLILATLRCDDWRCWMHYWLVVTTTMKRRGGALIIPRFFSVWAAVGLRHQRQPLTCNLIGKPLFISSLK